MGTSRFAVLGILMFVFQVSALVTAEEPTCAPGFESEMLIFKVTRKHLRQGTRLGKVGFTDCTDRTRFLFSSDDSRFMVQTDGMLTVKRQIVLHEGHQDFFIHSWDSQGRNMTVPVRVLHHGHQHGDHHRDHHRDHRHHNHQHHHTEVDSANNTESATNPPVPVLHFPKSADGLRRRKRDWVIPPINVPENNRGPFPSNVVQICSSEDKIKKIYYSITGPGADQDPVGLFTLDRNTGILYVTQPLDREKVAKYMLQAHAVADGSGNAEDPMDIIVNVIDQNDNKPVFTQDTFLGTVPEASAKDFEVITVTATDADEPNNDNSDIRYSIVSQEPQFPSDNLFEINPVTGAIRVSAGGLDREKFPNYTLVVRAADTQGDGLSAEAKVILTVTDSNDNASVFAQPSSEANPPVPVLHFPKSADGLRRRKRDWVIPPINIPENNRGPFPSHVVQIRSLEDKIKKIYYSITGPGADQDPVGLFTMDRNTGILYVTQPLDRERVARYMLQAHAVADGSGNAEDPMDIILNVIDQNDNRPVFTQDTFLGTVPEASAKDFEVITVTATDADEPNNDNSDIRYSIVSQEPQLPSNNLFEINPVTGAIRVSAGGLDREKFPNYTLVVRAADTQGDGLSAEAKVILTVTDSNDNASVFTQPSSEANPPVPVLHFPKSADGLRRRKRDWVIPPINVPENNRGPFPSNVVQIRSLEDKIKKIYYSITGPGADQDPVGLFTMDRNTGILYVTQPLDREKVARYMLQAHAVADGSGNAEDPMDIILNVIDQNDNRPVFTQDTFLGTVPEASAKDFEVITVTATDADEPNNDNSDIRYSIVSQEPQLPSNNLFEINPVTGAIRISAGGLDREKFPNYTLVVRAADTQGDGLSAEAKVILTVTDSNDNASVFTQPSSEANPPVPVLHFPKSADGLRRRKRDWVIPPINVPENNRGPFPSNVVQIRSSEDKIKKIYYSITGPGADQDPVGLFTMDRNTGILYVTQPLDREKVARYMLQAHVVADGSGNAEEPMDIIVNVIDQNDNRPVFTQDTFLGTVPEASAKDFEVITVTAADADEPNNDNSDIRYRIISQEPQLPSNNLFEINPVTGAIRVSAGGLDREKFPNYTLVVRAADTQGEGLSAEAKVILTVTDSNDNASVFTQSSSEANPPVPVLHFPKSADGLRRRKRDWVIPPINVPENNRGPFPSNVVQIRSSEDRIKKIYYSITGPGADQDPVGLFTMDRNTGILYVTQPLDREKVARYMLQAHVVADVSGNAEEPMDIIVNVIDQNDNSPVFTQDTFLGTVPEASAKDFEVITVTATDADEPNNDNSDIRYSIVSQEPQLPSNNLFEINPVTGAIRVSAGGLDREKFPNYTLVVRAADTQGEGLSAEAKVILTVTDSSDNASVFAQPSSEANPPVPVLHFPKSADGLRRRKRDWVIPPINIPENNRGPFPSHVVQIRSLEDKIKKIYYSITGPGADQDPVGLFTMDRNTGILYVTQPLDREKVARYMLQAHAVADGSGNAEDPMDIILNVIDQNDNRPVFTQDTFLGTVPEASAKDFEVITVTAADADEPNNDNSDIRYSIISQEPQLPSNNLFEINPVTGAIRVSAGGLDREKYPNYTLVVRAADTQGEGLSAEAKVILTVTDSNDNAPVFTQPSSEANPPVPVLHFPKSADGLRRRKRDWVIPPINVPENNRGPFPSNVVQIRSSEDKIKKIYYSITGPGADQDPVGLFTMDRNTGILYVTQPLDREKVARYMLQAHVVADGSGNAEEPMDIIVNVIDQNDNSPVFTQDTFLGTVPEASAKDFEVITVTAADADEPNNDNSDIRYSIVSQEPQLPSNNLFEINPVTGAIRVSAGGLDREKFPNYTLVVRAADTQGEGLSAEAKVILTVTDSNDNASVFAQPSSEANPPVPVLHFPKSADGLRRRKRDWVIPPISVAENNRGPFPSHVVQIRSLEDKIKKIYYSITGSGADQDPVGLFTMDRNTGILYVTQPLDREKVAKYMLQAHAVADGSGNAEDPMDIILNVIDQNDNRPVFTQDTFLGTVPEASAKDFEVITVTAADADEPNNDNSDIRYSIVSQEPQLPSNNLFEINPVTGAIRVSAGGLDREKFPNYTLVVRAADTQGEGLSAEAKVILTVTDSSDNASVFAQPSSETNPPVPVLHFPKSADGLRRRKRDWVIPPINIPENNRGPFPSHVVQIRSLEDKIKKIYYSITGSGADQDPVGLFTMDRNTGILYVTQPLDRERVARYMLQAHAVADGSGNAEDPMDIIVNVIDQNDNRPVFTQDTFLGTVPEASAKDFEVITVTATDADEPNNDNSDIRYRIISQEPQLPSNNLFEINPVTGAIRVSAGGLDREKYPKYTLVVRAADTQGEGLSAQAKVILTVTDSNDNAPVFTQPSYEATVEENKVGVLVATLSVTLKTASS
ncbi:protocadherin Fat 4-like [Toxotes jaculatrix]|uniref:protocadherin Fat 4-like n=1 Tax=Toxotes jaculatrix TaxID=941984 RepID=UPI001B3A880D|nr:protocadherin Fat 4-like [Toxotes jaculatrix]